MGAALPFITAASMALSAIGSIQQGKQQAAAAKYNAQVQENNATIAKQNATFVAQEGAANTEREQMKTRATVGAIKAAQSANGVDVNTGSAVDVQSSAAELGELNAITVRSNAVRQAYGFQTQAASDQAQAALDRQQAKYDTRAGYMKAASTLIGQGTQGYNAGNFDSWLGKNSMNYNTDFGPDMPGSMASYGPNY